MGHFFFFSRNPSHPTFRSRRKPENDHPSTADIRLDRVAIRDLRRIPKDHPFEVER